MNYLSNNSAISKGVIITKDKDMDGLNSQYDKPKAKISIQKTFLFKICIIIILENLPLAVAIFLIQKSNAHFPREHYY